jgi:hypothetical protein
MPPREEEAESIHSVIFEDLAGLHEGYRCIMDRIIEKDICR